MAAREQGNGGLWVVWIVAGCAAAEVWATWMGLGSLSGFPVLHLAGWDVKTNWTLAVGTEAYGGLAIWVWLSAAPGPRSRRFAMWSGLGAFALSLAGQVAYHVMLTNNDHRAPVVLVGFVACLPVIVLILATVLTHFVHDDHRAQREAREAAQRAAREAARVGAENDERVALRAELDAAREAHADAVRALEAQLDDVSAACGEAQREAQEATQREAQEAARAGAAEAAAEAAAGALEVAEGTAQEAAQRAAVAEARAAKLERKLAAAADGKKPAGGRKTAPVAVPSDFDARAEALAALARDPGITGAALGLSVGKSERWGQDFKRSVADSVPGPEAQQD